MPRLEAGGFKLQLFAEVSELRLDAVRTRGRPTWQRLYFAGIGFVFASGTSSLFGTR